MIVYMYIFWSVRSKAVVRFLYTEFVLSSFQGFNGADLRNVCTEAGMSAIRAERDYVIHEDFMKVGFFFST